jgi:hypothetical protein
MMAALLGDIQEGQLLLASSGGYIIATRKPDGTLSAKAHLVGGSATMPDVVRCERVADARFILADDYRSVTLAFDNVHGEPQPDYIKVNSDELRKIASWLRPSANKGGAHV